MLWMTWFRICSAEAPQCIYHNSEYMKCGRFSQFMRCVVIPSISTIRYVNRTQGYGLPLVYMSHSESVCSKGFSSIIVIIVYSSDAWPPLQRTGEAMVLVQTCEQGSHFTHWPALTGPRMPKSYSPARYQHPVTNGCQSCTLELIHSPSALSSCGVRFHVGLLPVHSCDLVSSQRLQHGGSNHVG